VENDLKNPTNIDTTIGHGDRKKRVKKETIPATLTAVVKTGRKDLVRRRLQVVQIREWEGPETLITGLSE
jgi:hypothetical protein